VLMIHDPGFVMENREIPFGKVVQLVANSPHTAALAEKHLGIRTPIVPPIVHFDQYQTKRGAAKHVTLISPNPRKGLDLVLAMAERMSETPFLLVEGWPMDRVERRQLGRRLRALPNVTFIRSQSDMRKVYGMTKVLLTPSREHVETFGRVVVEAQVSGIPVLAIAVGALPWAVGSGGVVLPPESPVDDWVRELRSLLSDELHYESLSRAALQNSCRPEFDAELVLSRFEQVLQDVSS
jgi:glycosyltransferase involved in cell wall biosynthesis